MVSQNVMQVTVFHYLASGTLMYAEGQLLKEDILDTIRGEISMLICSNIPTPREPTPDPGPQCTETFEDNHGIMSCKANLQKQPHCPFWVLLKTTNYTNIKSLRVGEGSIRT